MWQPVQSNFHPTVEQVQAILPNVQLLALNSPLNPTGTVIDPSVLEGIARAVVNENERRRGTDKRPVMMLFDQVYWMLVAEGYVHKSPVQLVPKLLRMWCISMPFPSVLQPQDYEWDGECYLQSYSLR